MAETDDTIFLRDPSLEDQVRDLLADVPSHPDRIAVATYDDPPDPYHLAIDLYATSEQQLQDWIAEARRRLADTLNVTDAPTGHELDLIGA